MLHIEFTSINIPVGQTTSAHFINLIIRPTIVSWDSITSDRFIESTTGLRVEAVYPEYFLDLGLVILFCEKVGRGSCESGRPAEVSWARSIVIFLLVGCESGDWLSSVEVVVGAGLCMILDRVNTVYFDQYSRGLCPNSTNIPSL